MVCSVLLGSEGLGAWKGLPWFQNQLGKGCEREIFALVDHCKLYDIL